MVRKKKSRRKPDKYHLFLVLALVIVGAYLIGFTHGQGTTASHTAGAIQGGSFPSGNDFVFRGHLEVQNDNADNELRFHDPGNIWYTMGIDFSDGGQFKINQGPDVGSTPGIVLAPTTGNIGIGTNNPENGEGWSKVVDVLGGGTTKLSVRTPSIDSRVMAHDSGWFGSDPGMIVGTKSVHDLSFATAGVSRMSIDTSGSVGIGIKNPSAKLDVDGRIRLHGQISSDVIDLFVARSPTPASCASDCGGQGICLGAWKPTGSPFPPLWATTACTDGGATRCLCATLP